MKFVKIGSEDWVNVDSISRVMKCGHGLTFIFLNEPCSNDNGETDSVRFTVEGDPEEIVAALGGTVVCKINMDVEK